MTNRFIRISATAAAACALITGSILVGGPAMASSSSDEAAVRATWDQYGVPAATQNRLLADLAAGRAWDSLSGGDPVSSKTTTSTGLEETVSTYADGSIAITDLQKPVVPATSTGGPVVRASVGCKVQSSSHYDSTSYCNVSTNVVVANAAYVVTYHAVQGKGTTIVSRSSNSAFTTQGYLGSISSKEMRTNRATQSGNTPAEVTGYFTWTSSGSAGSKDFWLQFNVRGTSTSASNN